MQVDALDLARLTRSLKAMDQAIAKRLVADAMRKWGKAVRDKARLYAYPGALRTKKQLTFKVKKYRNAVWCAVGVRAERVKNTPREQRMGRKSPFVGWRSHFMEVGWRPWPKGVGGNEERIEERARNANIMAGGGQKKQITVYRNGKPHVRTITEKPRTLSEGSSAINGGRGWRRGIRGRHGPLLTRYATHYLYKAGVYGRSIAREYITDAIEAGIRDAARTA